MRNRSIGREIKHIPFAVAIVQRRASIARFVRFPTCPFLKILLSEQLCHRKPKFSDGTRTHPYCGKACAAKAKASAAPAHENICLYCRKRNRHGDFYYCGKKCAGEAEAKGPTLLEVPNDHSV